MCCANLLPAVDFFFPVTKKANPYQEPTTNPYLFLAEEFAFGPPPVIMTSIEGGKHTSLGHLPGKVFLISLSTKLMEEER